MSRKGGETWGTRHPALNPSRIACQQLPNQPACISPIAPSLYTNLHDFRRRPAGAPATLLGIQLVPPPAGADRAQPAGRPRHLRRHADRRRQVALLSAARSRFRAHRGRDFSPDRADARSGRAARADGNSRCRAQQHARQRRQAEVIKQARQGAYRLLYLSPERLSRGDTVAWLQNVPIAFFAIDEAHCISEWGHEFRPEYRQLSRLRSSFADRPIAAFTASATRQVRHDILSQLHFAMPINTLPAFTARTCAILCANAIPSSSPPCSCLRFTITPKAA